MTRENQLPEPEDLYQYLRNAIRDLYENSEYIDAADYRLEESLRNAKQSLEFAEPTDWSLNFNPFLVFELDSPRDFPNGNGQARLGANIQVSDNEYEMFSCVLILAIDDRDNKGLQKGLHHCCLDSYSEDFHVLERMHWDVDTGELDSESKPLCHFQVGGKLSGSEFGAYEDYHYCSNGLDKPRIPHPPMGPILIFNMLIKQYHSLESFQQDRWKTIISNGEEVLWEPYFEAAYGMVQGRDQIMDSLEVD